jgi:hypothetical protein
MMLCFVHQPRCWMRLASVSSTGQRARHRSHRSGCKQHDHKWELSPEALLPAVEEGCSCCAIEGAAATASPPPAAAARSCIDFGTEWMPCRCSQSARSDCCALALQKSQDSRRVMRDMTVCRAATCALATQSCCSSFSAEGRLRFKFRTQRRRKLSAERCSCVEGGGRGTGGCTTCWMLD